MKFMLLMDGEGREGVAWESLTSRSAPALELDKVTTFPFPDGEIEARKRKHIFK